MITPSILILLTNPKRTDIFFSPQLQIAPLFPPLETLKTFNLVVTKVTS